MTTANLLVELFVEELPPKALQKLGDAFASVLHEQLAAQGLTTAASAVTAYASPRRLAAHISAVLAQAPDKAVSQKLMPVAVGLEADGQPKPALLKKLAALGADASVVPSLQRVHDGKADVLYFASTAQGASLAAGLQKALDEAIAKLPIPKVMTYQLPDGWSSVHFVRPAHGLVALHGADVVPVSALGLQAGNSTQGHRFEATVNPVVLHSADSYAQQLRDQGAVIASFAERRADIVQQLKQAADKVGGGVVAIEDEALLDEVTALVERPNVLICQFEEEFLAVPQECLILTMKANQKYFPLLDAQGKLTHQFLIVSNIAPHDASAVIQGNERVVRPRLADAKFFFDQDRKKTLASRVPQLAKVVYHNQLGTQGERVERVRAIAKAIAVQLFDNLGAQHASLSSHEGQVAEEWLLTCVDNAALLAKTDLVTDMVGEFPELQGIMGNYYARHEGLRDGVAIAIEDHYKPRFAGDALPRNHTGTVLALADKLETLAGMFGIGNLPTGDRDPFALRRHALGIIRILGEKNLPLQLPALIEAAIAAHNDEALQLAFFNQQTSASAEPFAPRRLLQDTAPKLLAFITERIATNLREQGYSAQEADAVLALPLGHLGDIARRLQAVRTFAALPEAPALAAANKRIANILKKAETEGAIDAHVSPVLLQAPAECALHAAMLQVLPQANSHFEAGRYTESLQTLAALRDAVDAFFADIMVNAEQLDLRLNRQGLLKMLHQAMNRVADLSRLAA